jgi:hypothetical protein
MEIIMQVFDEKTMNNGQQLNELQIERIVETIKKLSANSNNAQAITLYHNLKSSKTYEEKRKWIVLYYVSCFQLLSFVNLARDKDLPLDQYKLQLNDLFKGK